MAFDNWQGEASRKMVWTHMTYDLTIGSLSFSTPYRGLIAPSARVIKKRQIPSARAEIDITNFARELDGKIAQGDKVSLFWNYITNPTAQVEIFNGEVVNISKGLTTMVEARDQMWPVIKDRQTEYFRDEKPEAILRWFCDRAGVKHDIYETDIKLPSFPARNLNACEVADKLCQDIQRYDGTDTSDWAHFLDDDGQFVWGPFEAHKRPWQSSIPLVRVGEDVITFEPPQGGYGRLSMFPRLTVQQSRLLDIKQADGTQIRVRVEEVIYRQESRRMRMDLTFQVWE